jgi:histidinol phosphatase-like enzyme
MGIRDPVKKPAVFLDRDGVINRATCVMAGPTRRDRWRH